MLNFLQVTQFLILFANYSIAEDSISTRSHAATVHIPRGEQPGDQYWFLHPPPPAVPSLTNTISHQHRVLA